MTKVSFYCSWFRISLPPPFSHGFAPCWETPRTNTHVWRTFSKPLFLPHPENPQFCRKSPAFSVRLFSSVANFKRLLRGAETQAISRLWWIRFPTSVWEQFSRVAISRKVIPSKCCCRQTIPRIRFLSSCWGIRWSWARYWWWRCSCYHIRETWRGLGYPEWCS